MSQSLHISLQNLFEGRDSSLLQNCLKHSQYQEFLSKEELTIPVDALVIAFTHTSFAHEYNVPHQELLEFVGDSVLQLIVTDEIFSRYPGEKEGKLSKLRSSVVNEKSLAALARSLQLHELILVGKGEFKKRLHEQETVLADTIEALICQIYRFQGYDMTRKKVLNWMSENLPEAFELKALEDFDAKSKLQETTLALYKTLPKYQSRVHESGFLVELLINEKVVSQGVYSSKKLGERELARRALKEKLF